MTEDAQYGLVMPFVTCASRGGPHDDDAYVCGYEASGIDALLRYEQPDEVERYIHSQNVPQVDLIAMHHGYVVAEREPWNEHPDEWTRVLLKRESR